MGKKPWIDGKVMNLMKDRNKAFKIAKETDDINNVNTYKRSRNEIVKQLRINKLDFYKTKIDNNKRNPKQMWKTLKQLLGSKNNQSSINAMKFGAEPIDDKKIIVNRLNEYFINSIRDIVNHIDDNSNIHCDNNFNFNSDNVYL